MNTKSVRKNEAPFNKDTRHSNNTSKFIKNNFSTIAIILIIILITATGLLVPLTVRRGAEALINSYSTAYALEKDAAYQTQYQKYYDKAEKAYHVKNRVAISIGDLKEKAALEVLKVSDVEYIIDSADENPNNISSWLEVPGMGTYVVDLKAAEFIVDDERSYVLVRAPYPELTNITIDYANVNKLFFKNDLLNDSYKVGEELAHQQLGAAELLIRKEFASNQYFYLSAQKAARTTIQCLVRQMNPGVENLVVETEFY